MAAAAPPAPAPTSPWKAGIGGFFIGALILLVLIIILANVLQAPSPPGPMMSPAPAPGPASGTIPPPPPPALQPPSGLPSSSGGAPYTPPTPTTAPSTTPTPTTAPSTTPTPVPAPSGTGANPKKGFVYDLKINGAPNTQFNQQMQSLNLGWYYTWGLTGSPGLNLKFTPMCWGAPDAAKLNQIPTGSTELLAFNEPDGNNSGAQSNMSIAQIVQLWPQLRATGLRIGSIAAYTSPLATSFTEPPGPPAPGRLPPAQGSLTTSYFDALWTALSQANMTPDFIALHWYAPPDAAGFLKWIDDIYAKYNKPIWITEMCPADWNAGNPGQPAFERYTVAEIQQFMQQVVTGMYARPYVERFSWKTRPTSDINMGNGGLIANDGTLTPLGQFYATL